MPPMFAPVLAVALAAAIQAAPAPSPAAAPASATPAATPPAPPFVPTAKMPYQLTGEQVRQCGAIAANRNQHVAELKARDEVLLAEQAKLNARQAELQTMQAAVNTKKPKEVAAFNVASAEFNAAVPLHREKLAARNAYAAEIGPIVDTYNVQCARKSMNPADVAALPADQRAVVGAGATTSTVLIPGKSVPASKRRRQ